MGLDALCRALDAVSKGFDCLGGWSWRFDAKEARKPVSVRLNAMRDFHALLWVKIPYFIVNAWFSRIVRDFHAFCEKCVIVIHWLFGVLACWHPCCFCAVVLWIARCGLERESRFARFRQLLAFDGTVCVLDSRALACVCCFVTVACWQWGNRLLPVGVCVQIWPTNHPSPFPFSLWSSLASMLALAQTVLPS